MINTYRWDAEVRDSELDLQGIVNNAFYFVYMEHCRHKHIKALGFDFEKLHQDGYDLLLRSCEIKFKNSLRSGDEFWVTSDIQLTESYKLVCTQSVIKKPEDKLAAQGEFVVVGIHRQSGKLMLPSIILDTLSQ